MNIEEFKKLPLMGIVRGVKEEAIGPLVEAVVSSGLKTIEITMNTPKASSLIKKMIACANGRLFIGAGTVLTLDELHLALDSGATFIVSPILVTDVVEYCAKNSVPVFPGAFTPQEIYNAYKSGATMVKVFPSRYFGPQYIGEIKGPFNNIDLMACGGVKANNVKEFFSHGASAVAFGASILKNEWMEEKEFSRIERCIKELIDGYYG
ncbi:MAG: hypothetical protein A2Y03_01010 [Omnitrophica WOR_2 bacterium GWF2_38_59]|nr:MAG: hypothetical protein A2Y06_00285 [Omnitrophica WOR_2 bacterium GWA2_37_7]OGX24021.1 MAG: hypothetical protein A2Y03_01010 [Omnitrophica WOR_2 bacterium GWF2_38_59]OGX46933.1 MAG: hypothetical protein A2243_12130 [Omnitrophica WOR_2 bacterium RIFOXYA2_FULL_38_17]OGX52485.1 MAG: hypothetical protein A2267_05200 [Omnitrophica WOR_2 bacterium RIFOXYA12_FULL_38_10]OGX56520.1 MAG: hypothetical protein A2447_10315 [Omnitrophica WOR_2 bacterium RIFOXYC2_FULL_38_12]OGX58409.1 MAG: hypothetical 